MIKLYQLIFEMDLRLFENKIFSQNGEDGITMKLVELIYNDNNDNKYYVEFGVGNGIECNTRILRDRMEDIIKTDIIENILHLTKQ